MKTTTGIFSSRTDGERVLQELHRAGFPDTQLSMLTPGETNGEKTRVTTTDGEQPGMGKVIGGVVGAAVGASGGLPLGIALSSLLFPGLGPVMAVGFIAATVAGAAGAAGGAAAGGALEDALTEGIPHDELYFYDDALRHGKTVLIFRTDDDAQLERVKKIMTEAGAESIDAAREKWWIGLRDTEADFYEPREDFSRVEANYRKGFKSWRERAPAEFLFAVKFSRYGSHLMRLKNAQDTIRRFDENARELKKHFGPVLVQLPPQFKVNPERLDEFLREVPRRERWTVEFRDASWLTDEVYTILRRHKVALCIHDKIADHPREITADWTYIRFHGGPHDGNYTERELKAAAREIEHFVRSGLDVYAYFNNDWHGYAIDNALTLKRLLTGEQLPSALSA